MSDAFIKHHSNQSNQCILIPNFSFVIKLNFQNINSENQTWGILVYILVFGSFKEEDNIPKQVARLQNKFSSKMSCFLFVNEYTYTYKLV